MKWKSPAFEPLFQLPPTIGRTPGERPRPRRKAQAIPDPNYRRGVANHGCFREEITKYVISKFARTALRAVKDDLFIRPPSSWPYRLLGGRFPGAAAPGPPLGIEKEAGADAGAALIREVIGAEVEEPGVRAAVPVAADNRQIPRFTGSPPPAVIRDIGC